MAIDALVAVVACVVACIVSGVAPFSGDTTAISRQRNVGRALERATQAGACARRRGTMGTRS